MKKMFYLVLLCTIVMKMNAQDRMYWSASCPNFARMAAGTKSNAVVSSASASNPTSNTSGWFQGTINPVTGELIPANNSYYNNPIAKGNYPVALSSNGYLYTISGNTIPYDNKGIVTLISKPANTFDNNPPTSLSSYDVNGSSIDTDINPQTLAIGASGNGGLIYDENGDYRYNSFTVNTGGTVTWGSAVNISFNNTDNSGDWISYVEIADMTFDENGNLFILATRYEEDTYMTQQVIYTVPAANINGSTIEAGLKWVITDNKDLTAMTRTWYSGLTYASGSFYLAQAATPNYIDYTNYITAFQAPASGTSLVLPDTYTALTGYCKITNLAAIPETALPVHMKRFTAFIRDNTLQVNWQTANETNNSYFDVEISSDGKTFTKIGQVNSVAINGTSGEPISYNFETNANDALNLLGGLSGIALLGIGLLKRNNKICSLLLIAGVAVVSFAACKKSESTHLGAEAKVFIRLKQIDIDGKSSYSKVIQLVNTVK